MPYIKKENRPVYEQTLRLLILKLKRIPEEDRDGHINYVVTYLLDKLYKPPKYRRYNKAMGVLECIKQEYYRRVVAKYEDQKMIENGDVYGVF